MKKIGVLAAVATALFLTMACGSEPSAGGDDDFEGDDDAAEETTGTSADALTQCSGSCKRLRCWPRPTLRKKTRYGCVFLRCGSTVCG